MAGTGVGALFGDGSDGDDTIEDPTTLTRDTYYDDLTVAAGERSIPAGTGSSSRGR